MFFSKKSKNLRKLKGFTFQKLTSIKSGQRVSSCFKNILPLVIKLKRFRFYIHSRAGRGSFGRVILRTRKSLKYKHVRYLVNYKFRSRLVGFIAMVSIKPLRHNILSLFVSSSGSVSYVPTNYTHKLFKITRMCSPSIRLSQLRQKSDLHSPKLFILPTFFFISHLPRNQHISLLELKPGGGIKFARSPGVFATMSKLDVTTYIAFIKLPSGVRKIFSGFSIGSPGKTPNWDNRYWRSNKAGYYSNKGRRSIVRGVARNPIDHPHGGRTKTIRYPRTPWGKTTKFK